MGDITDHFSRSEFACKCGCGLNSINIRLVQALEMLRNNIGKPIVILSGCRCAEYNEIIGGSPKSQHMLGKAADIAVKGMRKNSLIKAAESIKIFAAGGIGKYKWGIHLDIREGGSARWSQEELTSMPANFKG